MIRAEKTAEGIEAPARDDGRRERMGEAAREWVVENHGWETIVDSLEDIYADVIDGKYS